MMQQLPVVFTVDQPQCENYFGTLVKLKSGDPIFCKEIKFLGDFALLNYAKIRECVQPTIKPEPSLDRYDYRSCSRSGIYTIYGKDVLQVIIEQNKIEQCVAVEKGDNDSLPGWVMRTKERAQEHANEEQKKYNQETLKLNTEIKKDRLAADKRKKVLKICRENKIRSWFYSDETKKEWVEDHIDKYVIDQTDIIEKLDQLANYAE
jgi:hypothetical protein